MIRIHLDRMLFERRLGVRALARRTGVSETNLSRLKNGRIRAVRLAMLDALCRALACTPGDLLSYEADPEPAGRDAGAAGGPARS